LFHGIACPAVVAAISMNGSSVDGKEFRVDKSNLAASDDNYFNDKISSFVVVTSGRWQFFRDSNFSGPASNVYGPGNYNWVEAVNIPNDSVSSVRRIA
jgi:hypothetical protein